MADAVRHEKYVFVDAEYNQKGHNKTWMFWEYSNGDVKVAWGRIGGGMQEKFHSGVGSYFVDKLISEKLKKGCKKIDTIDTIEDDQHASVSTSNRDLKKIAKQQIKFSNPIVQQLIDYLVEKNAHNIYVASGGKITYSADSGLFKTPLGIVTQSSIDEARKLLTKIGDWVKDKDWDNRSFVGILNDYMTLIPQDVGMYKFGPSTVFPDLTAVQKQNDVLDSLETSYASAIAAPKKDSTSTDLDKKSDDMPKLFDVNMELLDDKGEIKRISDLYYSTKNKIHYDAYQYRVKQIFNVNMSDSIKLFEQKGKPLGNIWELFHGSTVANYLSIFKSGLKVRPPSSANVTGAMFSNGVYASDQSTKALNYAINFWHNSSGGRSDRVFMLIVKMAMGKFYTPPGPSSSLPKHGYDSTFAKAHVSGVQNNEMIVYKDYQVNITHLIELEK